MLTDQQRNDMKAALVANQTSHPHILDGIDLDSIDDEELAGSYAFVTNANRGKQGNQCPCGLKHHYDVAGGVWNVTGVTRAKQMGMKELYESGGGSAQERAQWEAGVLNEATQRNDAFTALTANMSNDQSALFQDRNKDTPTTKLMEMVEFFGTQLSHANDPAPTANMTGAQGVVGGSATLAGLTSNAAVPTGLAPLTMPKIDWKKTGK